MKFIEQNWLTIVLSLLVLGGGLTYIKITFEHMEDENSLLKLRTQELNKKVKKLERKIEEKEPGAGPFEKFEEVEIYKDKKKKEIDPEKLQAYIIKLQKRISKKDKDYTAKFKKLERELNKTSKDVQNESSKSDRLERDLNNLSSDIRSLSRAVSTLSNRLGD